MIMSVAGVVLPLVPAEIGLEIAGTPIHSETAETEEEPTGVVRGILGTRREAVLFYGAVQVVHRQGGDVRVVVDGRVQSGHIWDQIWHGCGGGQNKVSV